MTMRTDAGDIAQQLDELALQVEPYDVGAAIRMRSLGEAVETGNDADAWAGVDVLRFIDPQEISHRVEQRFSSDGFVAGIELLRNALVFMPIVVTWFGISRAVASYYELLRVRPELEQRPFLYLWQGGFEGRLSWLPLSTLGLIVGGLLLVVFILTVVMLARTLVLNRSAERNSANLEAQLTHTVAEATLLLKRRFATQPVSLVQSFEQATRQLIAQLDHERQRIATTAGQRQHELDTLAPLIAELKRGSGDFLTAAGSIKSSYSGLADTIGKLAKETETVATQNATLLTVSQSAGQSLEALVAQQKTLGSRLGSAADTLTSTGTAVVNAARGASVVADQMLQSQTRFLESAAGDREKQVKTAQSLTEASGRLEAAAQAFKLSYNALASSVTTMTAPTRNLAEHTAQLATTTLGLLQPLVDLGDQQKKVGAHISDSSVQLSVALAEVATAATEIAKVADSLVKSQGEFLAELKKERESQERMANVVSLSADKLGATFDQIRQLAPALKAITIDLGMLTNSRVNSQP
jgi:hypothetical protein